MKKSVLGLALLAVFISVFASYVYLDWRLGKVWHGRLSKDYEGVISELFLREKNVIRNLVHDTLIHLGQAGKLVRDFTGSSPESGASAVDPLAGYYNNRNYFHSILLKSESENRFYFFNVNNANPLSEKEGTEILSELLKFNQRLEKSSGDQQYLIGAMNLKSMRSIVVISLRIAGGEIVTGVLDPANFFKSLGVSANPEKFKSMILDGDCRAVFHPMSVRTGKSYEGTRVCSLLKVSDFRYHSGTYPNFEGKEKFFSLGKIKLQESGDNWFLLMEMSPNPILNDPGKNKTGVLRMELLYSAGIFAALLIFLLMIFRLLIFRRLGDGAADRAESDIPPPSLGDQAGKDASVILKYREKLSSVTHPVDLMKGWNRILKDRGFEGEMVFFKSRPDMKKNLEVVYSSIENSPTGNIQGMEIELPLIPTGEADDPCARILGEILGERKNLRVYPVYSTTVFVERNLVGVLALRFKKKPDASLLKFIRLLSLMFGSMLSSILYSNRVRRMLSRKVEA